jgi:hypothetical protein
MTKRGRLHELEERIKNLEEQPEALIIDVWKAGVVQGWQLFSVILDQSPSGEYRLTMQQFQMIRLVYPDTPPGIPKEIFGRPLIIVDTPFDPNAQPQSSANGNGPEAVSDE